MEENSVYDSSFFERIKDGSLRSAGIIIPIVLKVFGNISSVLDVGCGTGSWLSVFNQYYGVKDFVGIDANVPVDKLLIPQQQFNRLDLEQAFDLGRKFDLVVSFETAEHLSKNSAKTFVSSLVKHGDVILFSAAIPLQGGDGHKNEQWQSYWANLFKKKGYLAIDCIRPNIWKNRKVEWWYRQNIILFVKKELTEKNNQLNEMFKKTNISKLNLIQPMNISTRIYLRFQSPKVEKILKKIPLFYRN